MKNLCSFLIGLLTLAGSVVNAQNFEIGSNVINGGVGVLGGLSYAGYSNLKSTPAINLYYERGFKELGPGKLGIGGGFEYKAISSEYSAGTSNYKATWTYSILALRGTYHPDFAQTGKFDGYGGLSLGYAILSYSDDFYDKFPTAKPSYPSYVYTSFFVGGRYYFTDKIGAYGEAGYGLTYLKLGLAFKF